MNARICTNPTCRMILPYHKCHLCGTATEPLPHVSLAMIGIDGTAHLDHTPDTGYSIAVHTASGASHLNIPLNDLLRPAQLRLPNVDPASGLAIMDALSAAAALIRTKHTAHWTGWIIYLLEVLQNHADQTTFQEMLRTLQESLSQAIVKDSEFAIPDDIVNRAKSRWSRSRGYDTSKGSAWYEAHLTAPTKE